MTGEHPGEGQPASSADLIAEQDAILHRVSEFIREGMRAGRISDESGELLITAAEKQHYEAVKRLQESGRYLS